MSTLPRPSDAPAATDEARRPLGIWLIAGLLVLNGLVALALLVRDLPDLLDRVFAAGKLDPDLWPLLWAWAAANLVAAFLLWRLSRRGWALTMVIVGLGLVANLVYWWVGEPNHLRMALNVVMAFYLNSRSVRAIFERRMEVTKVVLSSREPR